MKHKIFKHAHTYSGNAQSGANIDARLKHGGELCEIDTHVHISFTPGHPAAVVLGRALNVLSWALEIQDHVEQHHNGDWDACPVAKVSAGKDVDEVSRLEVFCPLGDGI